MCKIGKTLAWLAAIILMLGMPVGTGSWSKLADTTALTYIDKTAKSGTRYIYTVRCINSTGKAYTSAYNTTGLAITCK